MNKIKNKYQKMKNMSCSGAKQALAFGKEKMNNVGDLEKDTLKYTLFSLLLVFIASFALAVVGTFREIDKKITGIVIPEFNSNIDPELEKRIHSATAGYPIENMTRYIASENEEVAAFLISIAKKESNWGKRTPKLNGEECYNYWGFRQKREKMGSGGHTCFDSPRDAVNSVADRIEDLIAKDVNTPAEMVLWKCGYSCASHNPESVQKWIDDVEWYYNKF